MNLSLVRLGRSRPPSAGALRAALQHRGWLSPDSARRGPWARTFGFPGGQIQITARPDAPRHAVPGLVAKLLPDADFAALSPLLLALAAELRLGFDVPGSDGALWWPAPDRSTLPPGTVDRAIASCRGCDAREAWPLLGFSLAGPECLELAESHPALAVLLANAARVDGCYRVDLPAGERGPSLQAIARRPRREILAALGFPATESMVRLLGKIPRDRPSLEFLCLLRDLRLAPHAAKALRHLERFGSGLVPIAVRRRLWPHVGPQLLREAAEEADEGSTFFRLRDTVDMAESLGRLGDIGIVPSRAALETLHDRLRREHEERAQRNLREARRRDEIGTRERERPVPLPAPPAPRRVPRPRPPGQAPQPAPPPPPGVVPLLSRTELRKEGREMSHCVGSYWRQIERGDYAAYRILTPERATLGVRWSRRAARWSIDQIRGFANAPVHPETRLYLRDWIETGVVAPEAARWALERALRQHQNALARLEDPIAETDRARIRRALARSGIDELPRDLLR